MSLLVLAPCGSDTTVRDTAHHHSFQQLQPRHLAFRLPLAPRLGERRTDRRLVWTQAERKAPQFPQSTRFCLRYPRIERGQIPLTHQPSKRLNERRRLGDFWADPAERRTIRSVSSVTFIGGLQEEPARLAWGSDRLGAWHRHGCRRSRERWERPVAHKAPHALVCPAIAVRLEFLP